MLVVVIVAVICGLFVAARNQYYAERLQVQSILAEVNRISDVTLHSHVDVMEEVNSTSIAIQGVPESIVTFGGFAHYEGDSRFSVARIGKWRFRVSGRRHSGVYSQATGEPVESDYIGGNIGLGPRSPYQDLIPFKVSTIQDVVDHYEDFVDLLETWPRESAPGAVTLDDGTTQYFYVIEDSLKPNSAPR
jgi:hypothetical protein